MRNASLALAVFLAIFGLASGFMGAAEAAAPDIVWTKSFGSLYEDYANSVQQTSDGRHIAARGAYSTERGNPALIVKLENDGAGCNAGYEFLVLALIGAVPIVTKLHKKG